MPSSDHRWSLPTDGGIRILFVDDDPILGEFARVHLATAPTVVDVAVDGSDAWSRLENARFDIVLLDIEMPVLDGFGLLERMRADPRFADTPVVMLTGREDIRSIDRAFQLGANSFINKPINWRQLSYSLRYVLRSTRMESELLREQRRSDELRQLTSNLLSLLKLEARTPLSAIIGFSDCIRREIHGPVGAADYLSYAEQIDASARQLQDRLMDLIQYAQLTSGAATLSDDEYMAAKVMDAAVAGLAEAAEPLGIEIEIVKPHDNLYLLCDLHWMARALRHLLEIAISEAGAERVQFAMRHAPHGDGVLSIIVTRRDRTGPAASDQTAARPASLENMRHDLGVGVPFARRIAELHDAELITRETVTGSIMEIALPSRRVIEPDSDRRIVEAA